MTKGIVVSVKEAIHIKNFGPVRDINIPDVKPLTVFIGESGSGKSTVMKVLALFRWFYKMCNIREYLHKSNISTSPFRFRIDTNLANCGFQKYVAKGTKIVYTITFDAKQQVSIIYQNGKLEANPKIPSEALSYTKLSFIAESRGFIPNALRQGALPRGADFGYYFHEALDDFTLATSMIDKMPLPFLNVLFSVEKTSQGRKYFVSSLKGQQPFKIEYKDSSSGIQNTVPLSLILKYYSEHFDLKKAFNETMLKYLMDTGKLTDFKPVSDLKDLPKRVHLHLEEPELGLFPDAQGDLMNSVARTCFSDDNNPISLTMATHSPYILNHLNLLIKAHDSSNTTLTDGARLNYDDIAAYHVADGGVEDLKMLNHRLIDTNALSDAINVIYNRYEELK